MARRSDPSSPPPDSAVGPALQISNRQRRCKLDTERIRRLSKSALPLCAECHGPLGPGLAELNEIEVSLVSSAAMSRAHRAFLGIDGPTDVITFPYGEILVCPDVASENAPLYGSSVDDEVALYIIHGLLHLNGFDDTTASSARQMRIRQAKILNAVQKSG